MNVLFLKIINMSISASWLVMAVLILRLVLNKAPKWVNVLLWGIVAVRLICPFSFESALSLIPSAETFPEKAISIRSYGCPMYCYAGTLSLPVTKRLSRNLTMNRELIIPRHLLPVA